MFEKAQAREYAMNYGITIGVLSVISFLFAMHGLGGIVWGHLSNIVGLITVYVAGRKIRSYNNEVSPLRFSQACYLAFFIYLFGILITAVAQYAYFALFDNGALLMQTQELLEMPEYRQLLSDMTADGNIDEVVKTLNEVMGNPIKITFQLMWLNSILAMLLIIPTAMIGLRGTKK